MKNLTRAIVALALTSFGAGCGKSSNTPTAGENGLSLLPPAAADGLQFRVVREDTAAGFEHFICRNYIIQEDVDIVGFEHEFIPGHHVAIQRVGDLFNPVDAPPVGVNTDSVFDCGDVAGPVLFIRSTPKATFLYPDGVAIHLSKGTVIRLEYHWLNLTPSKKTADGRINLIFAKTPVKSEASGMFFYDTNIVIPPMGTQTVKMRCPVTQDVFLVDLVPHAHTRATGMRAWATPGNVPRESVTSSTSRVIFESRGWGDLEERPRHYSDHPLPVHLGEYIDFECDYKNDDPMYVTEGESRNNSEMCLFVASYFPRMVPAGELCLLPNAGSFQQGGKKTCSEVLTCSQKAGGNTTLEGRKCFLDVCPASQGALNNVANCVYQSCQSCQNPAECEICTGLACGFQINMCTLSGC